MNTSTKKCVTCQYYEGERDTTPGGRSVRYDSGSEGRCTVKKNDVDANHVGCHKYEKWGELK